MLLVAQARPSLQMSFLHMQGNMTKLLWQLAMALSGIAATLLKLGTTFHKRFGVPIPCLSDSSSNIGLGSKQTQLIRDAAIIMIDEI